MTLLLISVVLLSCVTSGILEFQILIYSNPKIKKSKTLQHLSQQRMHYMYVFRWELSSQSFCPCLENCPSTLTARMWMDEIKIWQIQLTSITNYQISNQTIILCQLSHSASHCRNIYSTRITVLEIRQVDSMTSTFIHPSTLGRLHTFLLDEAQKLRKQHL